jgi:hypothetical protein
MRITMISALLALGVVQAEQGPSPPPTVTPLFMSRESEGGPAFLVECRNSSGAPISTGADAWPLSRSAIRIDGAVLDEQGGRIGPGLTQDVPPGGVWRGIIELGQAMQPMPRTSFAPTLGANVRMSPVAILSPGRHVISVRCLGVWAADLPFYWEG